MSVLDNDPALRRWLLPAALTLAGLLIVASTPWLFSHERWVMDDPDRREHVFTLVAHDGRLYRGSQNGTLRVLEDGNWRQLAGSPGRGAIMYLLPERELAILNNGLWEWATKERIPAPGGLRVSHAALADERLYLGTGNGVFAWDGEVFHHMDLDAQVYRLHVRHIRDAGTLHAGTIAAGIWYVHPAGGKAIWQSDNEGLPSPLNVLSLLEVDNGILLAGTDQGLYWQAAPGDRWRRVDAGLGERRVLSLALDDEDWLWAGSDDGAYRVRLVQRERSVETQGRWEKLRNPPGGLDRPVSWVVPVDDTVWISAGAVYRLDRVAGPHVYQQLAVGLLLIALALYLVRRRTTGNP